MLFLDEIGDMPLALQTRLLRVLQEKEVAPLGASRSVPVNFALICATHRNLTQRVSAGEFREDLLWRLRNTPWRCLRCASGRRWKPLSPPCGTTGGASRRVTLSNALLVHLSQLPWPGNVRQLQSVLKVMLALADEGDTLTPDALPEAYRAAPAPLPRGDCRPMMSS
nr:Acetoin catabolism regulatory protein [Klebsiella pneumoniae]